MCYKECKNAHCEQWDSVEMQAVIILEENQPDASRRRRDETLSQKQDEVTNTVDSHQSQHITPKGRKCLQRKTIFKIRNTSLHISNNYLKYMAKMVHFM